MISWTTDAVPDAEEAAAITAALAALLADAAPVEAAQPERSQWHASGRLVAQGLNPARTGVAPRWSTIERLRQRAAGGFHGIVGL